MTRRVLVLTHSEFVVPDDVGRLSYKEIAPWKTEYDVVAALDHLGYERRVLGNIEELAALREQLLGWKPHIVFNLLEEFKGEGYYVPYVLGYLELMRQPFTGCNPSSLLLADNKPMMKKILRYHRIPVPDFAVFPRGRTVRRLKRLPFPLIVKSTTEHGSVGIAQASVVTNDERLVDRVGFVHDQLGTDAIAEEYIDGRELYVGLVGNRRLMTLPVWEISFEKLPDGVPRIATERIKWDVDHQEKLGIKTGVARDLPEGVEDRIRRLGKRVYRLLGLNGYARMDVRLTPEGRVYLLEPNPNPDLAVDEDFAESAQAGGVGYEDLVQRIVSLGLGYHAEWKRR